MSDQLRRLLPLLFLVIATILVAFRAEAGPDVGFEQVVEGDHDGLLRDQQPIPGHAEQNRYHDGAPDESFVETASSILRKLEFSQSRASRLSRPSGVVGTVSYYAKELFFLLFMNGPPDPAYQERGERKLGQQLSKAVSLLDAAAEKGNADALYLLAEMNFYGNFSYPRNYSEAFRRYSDLARLYGNSSAQHMVGFMYATGIGDAVERDQAKALLYHTFAALGGNTKSEMTVAFRHHSGIATPRNCDEAAFYYKRVADKAMDYCRSGPPGGHTLVKDAYRLADEEGGVYGEGASVSSSGINADRAGPNSDSHAAFDDVLEYLDLMSRKGDLKATFSLGKLHYEGSRALNRNLRKARAYFMLVAKRQWTKDGHHVQGNPPGVDKIAAKAAGYLGRMLLRGEGIEQSFEKAMTWFRRGIAYGDPLCQYSAGTMYLDGYGVPKDAVKAADYFKAAADQDFGSAQVRLGALFLDQGDVATAQRYFELAARHGHKEAFYYLAELHNQGIGRERSCGMATTYYKLVAERAEIIHSSFEEANEAYEAGDMELALVEYMMAAEQGYEAAQANVAFLLDEERSKLPHLDRLLGSNKRQPLLQNPALALIYWTRSAKQSNIDSMVKMGDYYLHGLGTEIDAEKAAACYQAAAEFMQSAQALWNMGWMHENGIGVEQDFHLAKRYYDQALETNTEAYLPVKLSLLKLRMRSFWNTITHGRVNSIRDEPEPKKEWSFNEWVQNFLEDEHPYYHDADEDDYTDPTTDPMPGGDDYYEDIDEGIIESLVILSIAGALAFLLYYRQQRQLHHRIAQGQQAAAQQQGGGQGEQEQQAPQEDRGFFPAPDDPAFNQWVAGGIGH